MTDEEKIKLLQRELRKLEEENTTLRGSRNSPPAATARHEVEALIFQVRALKAKVAACEALLKEYQSQLHNTVKQYYRDQPRKP